MWSMRSVIVNTLTTKRLGRRGLKAAKVRNKKKKRKKKIKNK